MTTVTNDKNEKKINKNMVIAVLYTADEYRIQFLSEEFGFSSSSYVEHRRRSRRPKNIFLCEQNKSFCVEVQTRSAFRCI